MIGQVEKVRALSARLSLAGWFLPWELSAEVPQEYKNLIEKERCGLCIQACSWNYEPVHKSL